MDKTKPRKTLSGTPIANRVVANMRWHERAKVVDIKNVVDGYVMRKHYTKTVLS